MNRTLKAIGKEIIYGGHLASIGPAIIVGISFFVLGLKLNPTALILAYLIAYPVYGLDRYLDTETGEVKKKYRLFLVIFTLLLLMAILLILKNMQVTSFSLGLLIISLGYPTFFKPVTKRVVGFKNIFVATTYTLVAIFPFIFGQAKLLPSLMLFIFFFWRILSNTSFYDIKDLESDKSKNLKTLVIALGIDRFYLFMIACNLLSFITLFIGIYLNLLPSWSLIMILLLPYTLWYMYLAKRYPEKIKQISFLWADGELLLWIVLILSGGIWRF